MLFLVMASAQGFHEQRRNLLDHWDPAPSYAGFSSRETRHLHEMWQELTKVEAVGAWRSVGALCGQLMESHLKQRVMRAGRSWESVHRTMLNSLIEIAISEGLFRSDAELSIAGSIFAAKQLRNWSSHGAPWLRNPGETEATVALTLLVCYSGWLFPRPTDDQAACPDAEDDAWWDNNSDSADTASVSGRLTVLARRNGPWSSHHEQLLRRAIRYGTSRSIFQNLRKLQTTAPNQAGMATVVASSLADLVAAAGRGRARNLLELSKAVGSLGLAREMQLLQACLPRDGEALAYFVKRKGQTQSYFRAIRNADPQAFDSLLRDPEHRTPVVLAIADRLTKEPDEDAGADDSEAEQSSTGNPYSLRSIAHLLLTMPDVAVAEFLRHARPDLEACLRNRPPAELISFVKFLYVRPRAAVEGGFQPALVLDALKSRVSSEFGAYGPTVRRLHSLKLIQRPDVLRLVTDLVAATDRTDHPAISQQLLWDAAQYADPSCKAVDVASAIATGTFDGWDPWNRLSLVGLLHVTKQDPAYAVSQEDVTEAATRTECNRWELFRVVLTTARSSADIDKAALSLFTRAALLLDQTKADSQLGEELLKEVRRAVADALT